MLRCLSMADEKWVRRRWERIGEEEGGRKGYLAFDVQMIQGLDYKL
jgi:hypothetical protein